MLTSTFSFSQEENKEQLLAVKKANNFVYEGNELIENEDFISAEMEYRKAISEQSSSVTGAYNLGNSYYKKGNYEEALYRHQQAVKSATTKSERHRAFHNIGNALMKNENYADAVEAYKQALRNNPTDEETRYNLAVAKKKQKEQEDKQKDENKDDKDKEDKDNKDQKENEDKKENQDKEGDDKEDKKDKGDEEKKDDEKKDDEGKPKDEKKDKGADEKKEEQQKPKPQPGQLSPQQIKSLLEAMNNQEKKVQEKINAEKQKGVKIKTEKDW